jgi:hypothetical protein
MVAVLLAILGVRCVWLPGGCSAACTAGTAIGRHQVFSAARFVDSRTTLKRRSGAGRWCTRAGCMTCFS